LQSTLCPVILLHSFTLCPLSSFLFEHPLVNRLANLSLHLPPSLAYLSSNPYPARSLRRVETSHVWFLRGIECTDPHRLHRVCFTIHSLCCTARYGLARPARPVHARRERRGITGWTENSSPLWDITSSQHSRRVCICLLAWPCKFISQ